MKDLRNLGRVLTKLEQSSINGGIDRCGSRCKYNDDRKCCKLGCHHSPAIKYCPIEIPPHGVIDDIPTIV